MPEITRELSKVLDSPISQDAKPTQDLNQYLEVVGKMHTIAKEMRLSNPEAEEQERSTKAGDNHALLSVEFPYTWGVYTFMEGHPYPYEGFPFYDFVDKIDLLKKITRSFLSGVFHILRPKKYCLVFLLPVVFVLPVILEVAIYTYYRYISRFLMKPNRYCRTSRELYRVLSIDTDGESERDRTFRVMCRDLVCMMLEFDNAYRFRFQDIMEDLDQIKVKENVIKELLRLSDIAQSRETTQEIKDTWVLVIMGIRWYLRFDRRLQRLIKHVLSNLCLANIVLSEADKHYAGARKDYRFSFMEKIKK